MENPFLACLALARSKTFAGEHKNTKGIELKSAIDLQNIVNFISLQCLFMCYPIKQDEVLN